MPDGGCGTVRHQRVPYTFVAAGTGAVELGAEGERPLIYLIEGERLLISQGERL